MKKEDFFIIIAALLILVVIAIASILIPRKEVGEVNIFTDNTDYAVGDKLKVKVENNLDEPLCFSSCYPYYFEKKESAWNNYRYTRCSEEDMITSCVNGNEVKAFELEVPAVEEGTHRMALPACIGCTVNNLFKESIRFYSNEFIIK